MLPCDAVRCEHFPCACVTHDRYAVPTIDVAPERVRIVMVSEAAAPDRSRHDTYSLSRQWVRRPD